MRLKEQMAAFFKIARRTIDHYIDKFSDELAQNGYAVLRGNRLKNLKLSISALDVHETDFVNIKKAPQLGIFDFRAILNLAMMIAESECARLRLRTMASIDIDTTRLQAGD